MDEYKKLYDKGWAVGQSDIKADCLDFRFRDERFTVYSRELRTKTVGKPPKIVARIEDVRKFANA